MNRSTIAGPESNKMSQVVTFEDGVNFVKRHSIRIIGIGLAGALIGLGLTFVIPKQWESTAVLQVGQIAADSGPPTQVETTSRAVERLKLEQFQDSILTHLGLPLGVGESKQTDLFRSSSKIMLLRNADLIQISTRGYSPDEAKRFTQAYGEELINAHAVLAKPSLDKLKADLTDVRDSLAVEEQRRVQLANLLEARNKGGDAGRFSENVLLNDLVSNNDKQLRQLRLQKNNIEERLNPERTFNTRLLGVVDVTRRAVYPKKSVFTVAGLAMGLFVALILGLWLDRSARARAA
ncbi:Wzz/FepE/Etk N-terminal domain-containing protein [Cupriavidus necator]